MWRLSTGVVLAGVVLPFVPTPPVATGLGALTIVAGVVLGVIADS